MAWKQLVPPDLSIRVWAGWCLSLARQVARAPAREATAWDAWANAQHRHGPSEPIPNVPVILWFSHWNTYNGVHQNWGHVVYWIPGGGFLSSPGEGYGQEWLSSVAAVVARFGGAYVGWSEDISTQRVAQLIADTPPAPTKPIGWEERMQIQTFNYTTTQYLVASDGTKIPLYNPQEGQAARWLCDHNIKNCTQADNQLVNTLLNRLDEYRNKKVLDALAPLKANEAAQTAAIQALAKGQGIDPKLIEATIKSAVDAALKGLQITLTNK